MSFLTTDVTSIANSSNTAAAQATIAATQATAAAASAATAATQSTTAATQSTAGAASAATAATQSTTAATQSTAGAASAATAATQSTTAATQSTGANTQASAANIAAVAGQQRFFGLVCRAWVVMKGDGTIVNSFNTASTSRTSVGVYLWNLTAAIPNSNPVFDFGQNQINSNPDTQHSGGLVTTTQMSLNTTTYNPSTNTATAADTSQTYMAVYTV